MISRASVQVDDQIIPLNGGESVLEALERAGLPVASGCRSGSCCKCMLQAENPPAASQRSLRPTLREQGYFLACQAKPDGLLRLIGTRTPEPISVTVHSSDLVAPNVVRLALRADSAFEYRPGQYLDVIHPSGVARSYSIASLPDSGELELHVGKIEGGLVSSWLHELQPGSTLQIRGAFGQCFYVADDSEKKLLLIGVGTGLAPLLGILRDALAQGHRGPIELIHGGLNPSRLYLRDELARISSTATNLNVHHCVLRDATESEHEGALDQVAIRLGAPLEAARVVLCGDSEIVRMLQRSLFLAGVASSEILADAFESPPAQIARRSAP